MIPNIGIIDIPRDSDALFLSILRGILTFSPLLPYQKVKIKERLSGYLMSFQLHLGHPLWLSLQTVMQQWQIHLRPSTVHILCSWHIYKNFHEHLHPLFVCDNKGWQTIANYLWRVCKRSDLISISTFNREWSGLLNLIQSTPIFQILISQWLINKWLEIMKDKKTQWASRYT